MNIPSYVNFFLIFLFQMFFHSHNEILMSMKQVNSCAGRVGMLRNFSSSRVPRSFEYSKSFQLNGGHQLLGIVELTFIPKSCLGIAYTFIKSELFLEYILP